MARAIKAEPTTTGTILVDKARALPAIPADLAALETAAPAAGQPANEQWQAVYGTPGNYQLARIVAGAWVGADEDAAAIGDWAANEAVDAGALRINGTTLYRRNTAGTTTAAFDVAEQANWTPIGDTPAAMTGATAGAAGTAGTVPAPAAGQQGLFLKADGTWAQTAANWAGATDYSAGQLAVNAGTLYRRNTAGTSGATFDAAEEANWTALGGVPDPMVGATASAAGQAGTVPLPNANQQDLSLHADGFWRQKVPNWTASTEFSQGAIVFQSGSIWRRDTAGQAGLVFDATEEAEWTRLADATASGRTIHNFGAVGATALTRVAAAYQGEIHVEAPQGWLLDGNAFEDGDYFLAVNTSGFAIPSVLTPNNFAGAFLRDGTSANILAGHNLGATIDARWVITVTENGGNKFLNIYPFGTTPDAGVYLPTVDAQTLDLDERYLIGATHTVTLPATTPLNNGQFITMASPAAWGDLTGAVNTTGTDTLEPAAGLPSESRDIVTFISSFATGQWLVRTGGDPALQELALSYDTVGDLPDPALYTAGTQASVTNDGALTGVYVASGSNPGPGTGWVKA